MSEGGARQQADLWFDPVCPWAWITSRWLTEVATVRPLDIRWHIFSLSALNEDKAVGPRQRAFLDRAWGPARVVLAAERQHGPDVVKPLYDALGDLIHHADRDDDEAFAEALATAGLDPALAAAAQRTDLDDGLRASTRDALALVGDEVGTPVIAVDGVAFFGPVLSPAPRGEDAAALWDATLVLARTPGFFELKRTRTVDPIFEADDAVAGPFPTTPSEE